MVKSQGMLPADFKENMKTLLGEDFDAFEKSYSDLPFRGLRVNTLKKSGSSRDGDAADIPHDPFEPEAYDPFEPDELRKKEPVEWADDTYYFGEDEYPGRNPLHETGAYYIQEPSAAGPAAMLMRHAAECGITCSQAPVSDPAISDLSLRILDLCAAPGGKSTQLASYMHGKGILVSNEINRSRAQILSSNIERCCVTNALVLSEDPSKLAECFPGFFDIIMVDAPCSGEGMFRKEPAAIDEWSRENVSMCAGRQAGILQHASEMLRDGGIICYSTCTYERAENEDIVNAFLSSHDEYSLLEMRRWMPHTDKGEGQFAAVMVKGSLPPGADIVRSYPAAGFEPADKPGKPGKIWEEFASDVMTDAGLSLIRSLFEANNDVPSFKYFGDNLYIMPGETPALKGLKVLRCGLCLGSFKKDRFEPSHALALILTSDMVKNRIDINLDDAVRFLGGQTLTTDGSLSNGWVLVCYRGYSLGWGKIAGNVIKNHYPKGLRK